MFDGDKDCIKEHKNNDKPVESLALDKATHFYSENTQKLEIMLPDMLVPSVETIYDMLS